MRNKKLCTGQLYLWHRLLRRTLVLQSMKQHGES